MLMAQWRDDFVRTLIGALGEVSASDAGRAFAELAKPGKQRSDAIIWRAAV